MIRPAIFLSAALGFLAACGNGPMGEDGVTRTLADTASGAEASEATLSPVGARERRPEDNLTYSGQGNSGGILSHQGGAFKGRLEATLINGSTPPPNPGMYYTEGHTIEFHNGPLTGVQVSCGYGYRGNSRVCTTRNAREADIVRQHIGQYGYAAIVTVGGFGDGRNETATAGLHSRVPGQRDGVAGVAPLMPEGTATYSGSFNAGMVYRDETASFSGNTHGDAQIAADFTTGTVSGEFRTMFGSADGPVDVVGAFSNAVVGGDGNFHTAAGTGFTFGGERARGMVEGGIYGPLGEETVGTMAINNGLGGMTGVFFGTDSRLLQAP